jgi:UDP-N-acetylmuramoyl-L-alanyl-D-glutamate--2,6-diaminopimelate ligase
MTAGRLIVVVGAGGDRDQGKRPHMGAAAAAADWVFVTSDNPRSERPDDIIAQVMAGIDETSCVTVEPDRRRAILAAVGQARPGDLVMILGKGHEQGQDIGGVIYPFDDRAVAREAMGFAR